MENIKSYEDACVVVKHDPAALPDVSAIPEEFKKATIANFKLMIIAKALRGDWVPDWNNRNQYKWYPWFNMFSGFAFAISFYDWAYACVWRLSPLLSYRGNVRLFRETVY